MQCPKCQSENRPGRKFCAECGGQLAHACPDCGFANEPDEKFCGGCGKALRDAAPTPDASPPSPVDYTPAHLAEKILSARGALEGERKRITVLFADIAGSLDLIRGSDPEDAKAILDQALRHMMAAVHRYEGTVNRVQGDGIMALFGAPLAHEDHAVRACHAALAMQAAIARSAEALRRDHGVEVQVRVGLHSGEVVVRAIGNDLTMDYDAIGETTHLAGRMEQLALPGTIRLTGDSVHLAEGFVQVTSLGPVAVKGLPDPIELFELTGASATRSRFQAALARGLTRFVGRDTELAALGRALARARDGQGQIVAVVGEPGVGKSRLFYEFAHSHRSADCLVLESGSVSYGRASPYLPLIDLLKAYLRIEERDDGRAVREKVTGKLLTLDEALRPILPAILALLDAPVEDPAWEGLDPVQRRQRTLQAAKTLLLRESQVQPLVLVFEDLHWIDSESQAFLDSLIEGLPTARILLLVNYRPEYRHDWGSRTYYTQRRIDPLPQESAEELLAALLGEDPSLAPLRRLLIERTEGNPFFVEESVRSLAEAQILAGAVGAYRLIGDLDAVEVPATVQGVLAARIDRLAGQDKRLLQTAAVVGKDVPYDLLEAVAELPADELDRSLSKLQGAEFVYETRLLPDREYTFKHALTHEVASGSLLLERRQRLHARIAEAMERLYADRLAERADRLAHHYTEAGMPERAIPYWRQAGQRSLERSANPEAIAQLEKGLELLGSMPESEAVLDQRLSFLLPLGISVQATKTAGVPQVERIYAEARDLAQRTGNPWKLFAAMWGLWRHRRTQFDLAGARHLADQLFDIARQQDDPVFELQAHHALWTTLNYAGAYSEARDHVEKGQGLYDRKKHATQAFYFAGHDPSVCGLGTMAQISCVQGNPDQATSWSHRAVSLARDLDHPTSLVHALGEATSIYMFRREPKSVMEHAEVLVPLAEEWGVGDFLARSQIQLGWAEAQMGQPEQGIRRMQDTLEARRSAGMHVEESHLMAAFLDALIRAGRAEEGLEPVATAVRSAESAGADYWLSDLLRLKGEILLRTTPDDAAAAEAHFLRAIESARRQDAKLFELRAATSLARLWKGRGKNGEARELLAPVYGWFSEGFETADLAEARALLDEIGG